MPLPHGEVAGQRSGPSKRRAFAKLWRALRRNRKATVGALLLLFFVVLAVFPGQIAPYNPTSINFVQALPPSAAHWLGTTSQGQDIYSQLIWGTRQSLIIAFAAGGLATLVAVVVGVSAAYLGGIADGGLSLVTDVLLVIPIFPLIIVIAAYLRSAGLGDIIIVLGALGWSYGARQLARAGALLAAQGLPRGSAGPRRTQRLHHRGRDLADTDFADRGNFPRLGRLCRADRSRPPIRRPRRSECHELGHDALLGAEQRSARSWDAFVGDHAGRLYRFARSGLRLLELRLRRDLQPGTAPGAPYVPYPLCPFCRACPRAPERERGLLKMPRIRPGAVSG